MQEFTYKKILAITAPLMLGTFVQSIVTLTDAIFVSELGDIAIGAFGNGSLMYVSLFMFSRGLADGTQITIAREHGAGNHKTHGEILCNAQFYQLILSILLFLALIFLSEPIIMSLSESDEVACSMIDFIQVRGWGLFFAAQHITLVGFLIGLGKTNIILVSALLIAFCNIFLDAVLINGTLGFPELGLIGAPLASSISELVGFVFLLIYVIKMPYFEQFDYKAFWQKLNLKKYISLLKLSFPLMLQGVVSLSTWLVFFTLVEHMGTAALETAQNIRYMYFLALVPLFGFAASTKTIISNLTGQKKHAFIPKVQGRIILLSVIFMILFFHGALLYPETLIRMVDHNPDISETVLADSAYILRFISGSILIFSVAVVFYNSISGFGKTTAAFIIEVLGILVYITGCYFFMVRWNWSIRDIWWVEYIYFIALGVFSFAYLLYFRQELLTVKNLNEE